MSPEPQGTDEQFNPKRMALLQFYATRIEGLAHMIYRSDPPKYQELIDRLQSLILDLQRLAKVKLEARANCDMGEERCDDGLCHPKGDPTCCGIIITPIDGEQS